MPGSLESHDGIFNCRNPRHFLGHSLLSRVEPGTETPQCGLSTFDFIEKNIQVGTADGNRDALPCVINLDCTTATNFSGPQFNSSFALHLRDRRCMTVHCGARRPPERIRLEPQRSDLDNLKSRHA